MKTERGRRLKKLCDAIPAAQKGLTLDQINNDKEPSMPKAPTITIAIDPKEALRLAKLLKGERAKFEKACRPLIKYLCENHHPHTKVIVDCNSAEMVEGLMTMGTNDYVRD